MQTFLPLPDFAESARVLDRQRLGKQRVEAKQILLALDRGPSAPWGTHPAVRMWRGHRLALCCYGRKVCEEWRRRGYADSLLEWFQSYERTQPLDTRYSAPPWWWGEERFHSAHRAALLAKLPGWYSQWGWSEAPGIAYWWPTEHEGEKK